MTDENSNKRLRLFVAIPVPEPVRKEMARVQDKFRPLAAPDDVRWVNPQQLHLTLKFLGHVPADAVETVKAALTDACAGMRSLRLHAKGIGFFPNVRSPRVIWVGLENHDQTLANLQRRVEQALTPFTENPAEERFRPHVTLGRFQKFRRHKTEKLIPQALSFGDRVFGEWPVREVHLMQSVLSSSGARHTILVSVALDH